MRKRNNKRTPLVTPDQIHALRAYGINTSEEVKFEKVMADFIGKHYRVVTDLMYDSVSD